MNLSKSRIGSGFTGCQLYFQNLAAHFHDPLLLAKPVIVGNQLGKIGVLQLPLGANPSLTGNAGGHLEHTHNCCLS